MVPTVEQLQVIAGSTRGNAANAKSVVVALDRYGKIAGLDLPHRLAHFLSQLSHESGGFKYDQEIASGAAYEGRKDLGNTQPGDGKRFKGRGPIQITGRSNYKEFTEWCRKQIGGNVPDFEADPDMINVDPWEGLVPIWYWTTRRLNRLADENNIEQITKKINGGRNGLADRIERYTRAALVLAGYGPDEIEAFQRTAAANGLYTGKIDGDDGPLTRGALHMTLAAMSPDSFTSQVKVAPIVEEKEVPVEVPVEVKTVEVPKGADKPGLSRWFGGFSLVGLGSFFTDLPIELKYAGVALVILLVIAMLWRSEQIAIRAKRAVKSIEDIFG